MKNEITAMKLIKAERREHSTKHNWDDSKKPKHELAHAALFAEDPVKNAGSWPEHWDYRFKAKIESKSEIERLVVSGSLYLAEYQAFYNKIYLADIKRVAAKINRLLRKQSSGR